MTAVEPWHGKVAATERDPRMVRYDAFAEVQAEIAKNLALAEGCYRANKSTGDDRSALVAFGRLIELRALSEQLAWMATGRPE